MRQCQFNGPGMGKAWGWTQVFLNNFPITEVLSASYARVYALDDGIPAEWRERYFGPGYLTDPRGAAEADPDGDGWTTKIPRALGIP